MKKIILLALLIQGPFAFSQEVEEALGEVKSDICLTFNKARKPGPGNVGEIESSNGDSQDVEAQ